MDYSIAGGWRSINTTSVYNYMMLRHLFLVHKHPLLSSKYTPRHLKLLISTEFANFTPKFPVRAEKETLLVYLRKKAIKKRKNGVF